MQVQSLSVVVPATCMNRCPFCVSYMNLENKYFRQVSRRTKNDAERQDKYFNSVYERMEFARDNGTNTLMITSTGESLLNIEYIEQVLWYNSKLPSPFKWIELQTSGVGLLKAINEKPKTFEQIKTISLSVVDIFSSYNNKLEMGMPKETHEPNNDLYSNLPHIVVNLKDKGFNVRISINITNVYDEIEPFEIFDQLQDLEVNQVTFRQLYKNGNGSKQDEWIDENNVNSDWFMYLNEYIQETGRQLEQLPFGAMKYSVKGMSTVVDEDCMNTESKNVLKYLIIREDGKLYSRWDDKGSLIF